MSRSASRATRLSGTAKEKRPACSEERTSRPTCVVPGGPGPNSDARVREQFHLEPAAGARLRRSTSPARSRHAGSSRASGRRHRAGPAARAFPWGAGADSGAVPLELTVIVPFISVGWTGHTKVYVPACANVQLPLQLVFSSFDRNAGAARLFRARRSR